MATRAGPFGPGLLKFLRQLDRNNDRRWFDRNRERYEAEVREPALDFIRAMAPRVERLSPHLVAADRKVGGSMMRIHRDVRFSLDKRPYKTNLGIQFRHEAGKDVHAPGLYFHVEPGSVFLGAGMWRPDATALAAVRRAIDEDPRGWRRARDGARFRAHWEPSGDSLKRPPRGYPADHPLIDDIKRKDHIAVCTLRESDVTRSDLVKLVSERYSRARDYLGWLAEVVGLPF
jgi:uncharacterized protein (TIGR02453 family)